MNATTEKTAESWPTPMVYMLRTAQQNHVQLSLMADQKASILVGASFVVFTLALRDGVNGHPSIASLILAAASFLSALFAVLAIIPSTKHGGPGAPNLLFFGGFTTMGEDDYIADMLERTTNEEVVYRLMLRDLHQNGMVLYRKKYRYLAWAFRSFLLGLILSFGAYTVELALHSA